MNHADYQRIAGLVRKVQAGDSEAFERLYLETYRRQYRFALRYLRDAHLAQDATQETYLLVLKHLPKLHRPELFLSWLGQIHFRVCYDLSQRYQRLRQELSAQRNPSSLAAADGDPLSLILRRQTWERLWKGVASLPPRERRALILRFCRGKKLGEIERQLRASRSTVRRDLQNACRRLRVFLERE